MISTYNDYKVFERNFYLKQSKIYKKRYREYKKFLTKLELRKYLNSDLKTFKNIHREHNQTYIRFMKYLNKLKNNL